MKLTALQKKIKSLIDEAAPDHLNSFQIVFFGLIREAEGGWSVNDAIVYQYDADLEQLLEFAQGRWEIFKLNYLPKARIKNIQDVGGEDLLSLEVDCTAFLNIVVNR